MNKPILYYEPDSPPCQVCKGAKFEEKINFNRVKNCHVSMNKLSHIEFHCWLTRVDTFDVVHTIAYVTLKSAPSFISLIVFSLTKHRTIVFIDSTHSRKREEAIECDKTVSINFGIMCKNVSNVTLNSILVFFFFSPSGRYLIDKTTRLECGSK